MAGGEDETHIRSHSPNAFLAQRETSCQRDVHHFDLGSDLQAEIETLGDMFFLINTFHLSIQKVLYKYFSTQSPSSAGRQAGGECCTQAVLELQKSLC